MVPVGRIRTKHRLRLALYGRLWKDDEILQQYSISFNLLMVFPTLLMISPSHYWASSTVLNILHRTDGTRHSTERVARNCTSSTEEKLSPCWKFKKHLNHFGSIDWKTMNWKMHTTFVTFQQILLPYNSSYWICFKSLTRFPIILGLNVIPRNTQHTTEAGVDINLARKTKF